MNNAHDQVLSQIDNRHRIVLCEYGLVHIEWGRHSLVYCPGDLVGLPYLLESLDNNCNLQCLQNGCVLEDEHGRVALPYGSVQISLTVDECRTLHSAAKEASKSLHNMRQNGFFSNQKWQPEKPASKKDQRLANLSRELR